jgi:Zn ribbon nucleic-acid-binding protein
MTAECPDCGATTYTSQGWPEPDVENAVECNECAHEFLIVHDEDGYHVEEASGDDSDETEE